MHKTSIIVPFKYIFGGNKLEDLISERTLYTNENKVLL